MCLIKKYLDNYVATTEGMQRSHALVEGGGHMGSVLVEKAVRCGSSRVNGIFLGWDGSIRSKIEVLLCFSIGAFMFYERTNCMILFILLLKMVLKSARFYHEVFSSLWQRTGIQLVKHKGISLLYPSLLIVLRRTCLVYTLDTLSPAPVRSS
jgi:hypothetical protein